MGLTVQQRQWLLRTARAAAEHYLKGGAVRPPSPAGDVAGDERIEGRFGGVFVSFWRGELLRGCVGTFAPTNDMPGAIEATTVASLQDPRFLGEPITLAELPSLDIEVSVLTDPVRVEDPAALVVGRHGVIVRSGGRSGCFLPKVAAERGWTAAEFLSNCCTMKAGLPADAWRRADTELWLFEAEAFRESEVGGARIMGR